MIGNYIMCDYEKFEILEIWADKLRVQELNPTEGEDDVSVMHISNAQGIPLTSELLKNLPQFFKSIGFVYVWNEGAYGRKSFSVTNNTDNSGGFWNICITDFPPDSMIGTDCIFVCRTLKYLHELQNWFQLLTGTPLEVNF